MKYHALFLKRNGSSSFLFEALQALPQLSVTFCSGLDELKQSLMRCAPDFVFLGESLPDALAREAVEYLHHERWFLPVFHLCLDQGSPWRGSSVHTLHPDTSAQALEESLEALASRWAMWRPLEALEATSYLELPLSTASKMVCQMYLQGGEFASVEIAEGQIWKASCGDLRGEEALAALAAHRIREVKELHLEELPAHRMGSPLELPRLGALARELHTPFPKPTPPPLLMELETQTHLDAVGAGLAWLAEEDLKSTGAFVVERPLRVESPLRGEATPDAQECLFRAWQMLCTHRPEEARPWACLFARQKPDDPRLHIAWLAKLATSRDAPHRETA